MLEASRTVGRFEILRVLGRGGMALVYLARQTDLDRYVALKELSSFHAADPAWARRFVSESRIAGSLSHPNIVTVHDFIEHEGIPYIAMEYMERGSLRPCVGRLSLPQIGGVLEDLLAALEYANGRGIVHRDLKPENLMVSADGGVKIADFGIAKALHAPMTVLRLTGSGMTVGTPAYMAPEQAMAKEVGPWTDLYSTGVIAYELLAGKVPFSDTDTPWAILHSQIYDSPPPLDSLRPDLDPSLGAWVERLLAKEPGERPASALEAWHALEDILVDTVGPLWRRGSGLADKTAASEELPLEASAEQPVTAEPAAADEDEFRTFRPGRPAAEPSPTPPELEPTPPPEPEPVPVESAAAPAADPPAEPAAADDDFSTYLPHRPAPEPSPPPPELEPTPPPEPISQPEPVPVEAAAAAAAEPVPGDAQTVPPRHRPRGESFVWPRPERRPQARRGRIALIVGGLGLLAIAGVAVALVPGRHSAKTPATPSSGVLGTAVVRPDGRPTALQQVALAAAGPSLFVATPRGEVARLSAGTLQPRASVRDAARPASVQALGSTVYVADAHTITLLRAADLAAIASVALGGKPLVAVGARGLVVAAAAVGENRGRVCLIAGGRLGACARLGFVPTGLGVSSSGTIFAVDGSAGAVVPVNARGGKLVADKPISLGSRSSPHGPPILFGGKLYVAVTRGVGVAGPRTRKLVRTISLETTPTAISIVPFNGRMFAPLYASDKVAVVDLTAPKSRPVLVRSGSRPVAVTGAVASAGGGNVVYVANAGDATVARLDALSGKLLGVRHVAALAGPAVTALVARRLVVEKSGRTVTVRIGFRGGRFDRGSLVIRDRTISDGSASFVIWQGGIETGVGSKTNEGVTTRISRGPGRLEVALTAAAGAFTDFELRAGAGGRSIVIVLTKAPPPVAPTTVVATPTTAPSIATPPPTQAPPPTPVHTGTVVG